MKIINELASTNINRNGAKSVEASVVTQKTKRSSSLIKRLKNVIWSLWVIAKTLETIQFIEQINLTNPTRLYKEGDKRENDTN